MYLGVEIRAGSDNTMEAQWFFLRFTSKWKYFERAQRVTESWAAPITYFKSRASIDQHFPYQILLQRLLFHTGICKPFLQ